MLFYWEPLENGTSWQVDEMQGGIHGGAWVVDGSLGPEQTAR